MTKLSFGTSFVSIDWIVLLNYPISPLHYFLMDLSYSTKLIQQDNHTGISDTLMHSDTYAYIILYKNQYV